MHAYLRISPYLSGKETLAMHTFLGVTPLDLLLSKYV